MKAKPLLIFKIVIDVLMCILFILLLSYHLISDLFHEIIGVSLFVLFITHNIANYRWYKNLFKGKYKPLRIIQTIINFSLLIFMIGCIISAILISGYVFSFVHANGTRIGRSIHLLCTMWSFILISLHLGLHIQMFINMVKNKVKLNTTWSMIIKWILRIIVVALSVYGIIILIDRMIWEELFLLTEFKWFDYDKALPLYMFENFSMLVLFASCSYYLKKLFIHIKKH